MFKLYKRSYQARRWIKFGVLPSFLPIISVIGYDIYLGYNFENIINRHLLDFLLTIFAITVSVFSSAMILYRHTKSDKNSENVENHLFFTVIVGFFCSGIFARLYDDIKPNDILSPRKITFCLFQIIITLIIIHKGMQTEEELEKISQNPASIDIDNTTTEGE